MLLLIRSRSDLVVIGECISAETETYVPGSALRRLAERRWTMMLEPVCKQASEHWVIYVLCPQ